MDIQWTSVFKHEKLKEWYLFLYVWCNAWLFCEVCGCFCSMRPMYVCICGWTRSELVTSVLMDHSFSPAAFGQLPSTAGILNLSVAASVARCAAVGATSSFWSGGCCGGGGGPSDPVLLQRSDGAVRRQISRWRRASSTPWRRLRSHRRVTRIVLRRRRRFPPTNRWRHLRTTTTMVTTKTIRRLTYRSRRSRPKLSTCWTRQRRREDGVSSLSRHHILSSFFLLCDNITRRYW